MNNVKHNLSNIEIDNLAPYADTIRINFPSTKENSAVYIERDENGVIYVSVFQTSPEGGELVKQMILGKE